MSLASKSQELGKMVFIGDSLRNGAPIEGATVKLFFEGGDSLFTVTDNRGFFRISQEETLKIESIAIRSVGYEDANTHRLSELKNDRILLKPRQIELDEVLVEPMK